MRKSKPVMKPTRRWAVIRPDGSLFDTFVSHPKWIRGKDERICRVLITELPPRRRKA